jgi:hypothetical protein
MTEPNPDLERKRQLDCLRLASDFAQLAKNTSEPALKARCLRMADVWLELAESCSSEEAAIVPFEERNGRNLH